MTLELVESSFKYHLLILKLFGLYPFDSYPKIYKPYGFFFYIAFTAATPILALVVVIAAKEYDIEVISQKVMMIELNAMILKLLPLKINPEGTRRTVYSFNKEIFNQQLPEQDYILRDAIKVSRYNLLMFFTTCGVAVMVWASVPLIYSDRRFPLEVWLPFDPFKDTVVYVIMYIFVFLCVFNGGIDNSALDTLIASLLYHATCQIRVLKDTIIHVSRRAEQQISKEAKSLTPEEREQLKNDIIYERICHCIDHYDAIFQYVEDFESTYSMVLFSQMISSALLIGISCLHLSMAVPFTIPFFSTLTFVISVLLQQFLFCFFGTFLHDESDTVVTAIYMSDWYNFDRRSKKALLILMERAKRPMKVTAGKLMDLTLQTFAMIMRRSYSLLAIMKNY